MSNNNSVENEIGRSNFGGRQMTGGYKWFWLKDNEDNIFRVLPPVKSLARTGEFMKWNAVHRGLAGTNGKKRTFLCLEQKSKEGIITSHCPLCDKVREYETQLNMAKDGGASKEQLSDFRQNFIFPLQAEKKFYLNVVNPEGAIGVLSIGYKLGEALKHLGKTWEGKGFDITGVNGVFLNFKKMNKFKGDRDTQYAVDVSMQATKDGTFYLNKHDLTPEILENIRTTAADLSKLFKSVTPEQAAMLVTLDGAARAEYVDSIFSSPEKEEKASSLSNRVAGTNTVAVSHVDQNASGLKINSPQFPENFGAGSQHDQPKRNSNDFFNAPQQLTPANMATSSPSAASSKTLTDEEFFNLVKPK